jgi:hypothetical protein
MYGGNVGKEDGVYMDSTYNLFYPKGFQLVPLYLIPKPFIPATHDNPVVKVPNKFSGFMVARIRSSGINYTFIILTE